MEIATTPGTRTVANADSGPPAPRPRRSPGRWTGKRRGRRNEQERLDDGAHQELGEVLAHTSRSRRISARRAARLASIAERVGLSSILGWSRAVASVPHSRSALPGQVDEDRLEARLGDRQVSDLEAPALRRVDDAGHESVGSLHLSSTPPSITRVLVVSLISRKGSPRARRRLRSRGR